MKILKVTVALAILFVLVTSSAWANGVKRRPTDKGIPVCEVRKPLLEYVEDGLALVLDVPLALVSPVCGPIVSPIVDWLDPGEQREFRRYRPRR